MSWDKFEKLVSKVKQKISTIVLYKLKDPRVGFVTITKVELARDLKTCTVFYSVLGSQTDQSKTHSALQDARGFIQGEIGKTLSTRTIPRVEFRYDESMAKADRIFRILKEVKSEFPDEEADAGTGSSGSDAEAGGVEIGDAGTGPAGSEDAGIDSVNSEDEKPSDPGTAL